MIGRPIVLLGPYAGIFGPFNFEYVSLQSHSLTLEAFFSPYSAGDARGLSRHMWDLPAVQLPGALKVRLHCATSMYLLISRT